MSYQPYPPPSTSSEMNIPHPGYAPTYDVPPPGGPVPVGDPNWPFQRSFSTPDARPMQHGTDHLQLGLGAERRRNKLGYHRTSVACSHCRRRKIRCIPSTSDVHGRCASCIRLKKDCSFIPAEQQGSELHQKESSQGPIDIKGVSSPPSPTASGEGSDKSGRRTYSSVGSTHSTSTQSTTGLPDRPDIHGDTANGTRSSSSFEYGVQSVSGTMAPRYSDKPRATHLESSMNPYYNGYSQGPPLPSVYPPGEPLSSRNGPGWAPMAPPIRSVSYGGEHLGEHGSAPYLPMQSVENGYQSSVGPPNPMASGMAHSPSLWQQRQSRGFQPDGPTYGR
jgi:hypothetical protein